MLRIRNRRTSVIVLSTFFLAVIIAAIVVIVIFVGVKHHSESPVIAAPTSILSSTLTTIVSTRSSAATSTANPTSSTYATESSIIQTFAPSTTTAGTSLQTLPPASTTTPTSTSQGAGLDSGAIIALALGLPALLVSIAGLYLQHRATIFGRKPEPSGVSGARSTGIGEEMATIPISTSQVEPKRGIETAIHERNTREEAPVVIDEGREEVAQVTDQLPDVRE